MTNEKRYHGVIISDKAGMPPGTIEFLDDLDALHKLLACRTLDIPRRYVGGMEYRIILDDEGALKPRPVTGVHFDGGYFLFGTLLFTNYTADGNDFRDLTEIEVANIADHIQYDLNGRAVVTGLTFRP